MPRYIVVGATSWGVTLTGILTRGGASVDLLARTPEEAASLEHQRGITRLPGVALSPQVTILPLPAARVADGIVVAVPAQSLRATLSGTGLDRALPILSAAKGIEHESLLRMSEVLAECGWSAGRVSVISGPNLAHEVARGLPAASVIASTAIGEAARWQEALSHGAFRCYRSDDVVGVELGGALKNVIAIAAGAAAGLQLGANAIATLMTRGLAEMARLGVALGAEPITFQGLAGIGDLAASCYSPLSRNRRMGELLARGLPVAAAVAEVGETIEGVATAPVALALAHRAGVDTPITQEVAAVLAGETSVTEAMTRLLARTLRSEREELG